MAEKEKRIIIIGAGPCGLGAAYRLQELGYNNFSIYEKNDYIGGIAASFKDKKGFTWDQGGHVIFSHYSYFDKLMDKLLKKQYYQHLRESWIWMLNRFIPYPFQNNIRYLPEKALWDCLLGLSKAQNHEDAKSTKDVKSFYNWILRNFGSGIAKYFMLPYNFKVWATPAKNMSSNWLGERVSVVDFEKILKNIILQKDEISWGPNNKFKFPKNGGTGGLFNAFLPIIKQYLHLKTEIRSIDIKRKEILLTNGQRDKFDSVISTMPLNLLLKNSNAKKEIKNNIKKLKYNSVYVVGLGFKGKCQSKKCWVYFPEKNCPYYRLTFFSNYSPNNVPEKNNYSLMCEISESKYKKISRKNLIEQTIQGLINTKIISRSERKKIISKFLYKIPLAYPIATLERDHALKKIIPYLEKNNIFSRGRFGAWRYEIGNMDHATMQGVEIVNRLLLNQKEQTYTWK